MANQQIVNKYADLIAALDKLPDGLALNWAARFSRAVERVAESKKDQLELMMKIEKAHTEMRQAREHMKALRSQLKQKRTKPVEKKPAQKSA